MREGSRTTTACFAREDAARAYDRVNIAKFGHAKTTFPAAEYRDEWELLEAVGAAKAVEAVRDTTA